MDRLAACHAMYGFLQLPGHGRGRHPSAPNCQNVKRSLSLTDRRGLISPGRASGRGLISPMPNRMLARGTADEWEGMARKLHGTDSISRLHDFGFLMHALGRSGQMLLPAASAMEFGRGIGRNRSFTFGRRRRELDIWRGEQLGQLLVSLRYTVANSQLWVEVHRAGGVRATTPYVTVWLFRGTDKPEKRSTKPVGDSRRFSIAPVFDESFLFDVSPSEVRDVTLAVSVMNSGSDGDPDTEIGYCVIGELGPEEVGKWHWRETMGHQGTTVTHWHGLMADC